MNRASIQARLWILKIRKVKLELMTHLRFKIGINQHWRELSPIHNFKATRFRGLLLPLAENGIHDLADTTSGAALPGVVVAVTCRQEWILTYEYWTISTKDDRVLISTTSFYLEWYEFVTSSWFLSSTSKFNLPVVAVAASAAWPCSAARSSWPCRRPSPLPWWAAAEWPLWRFPRPSSGPPWTRGAAQP